MSIGIRIEITSMISHVKSCTEIHQFRKFLFTREFTSENKAATLREFSCSAADVRSGMANSSSKSPPQPGPAQAA